MVVSVIIFKVSSLRNEWEGGGGLYIALLSYYCKKERIAGDCNMTITVTKTFKSYSLLLVLGIKNDKIKKEDFLLLFGCYF